MSDAVITIPPVRGIADATAVAARKNSVVLAAPPSPAYAISLLASALDARSDTRTNPILLIAPDAGFAAWGIAAARAAGQTGKRSAIGATPARASHHLAGGRLDLLVTTVAVATELHGRSALPLDTFSCLVLVWPELEPDEEVFVPLLGELGKETPRIVVTADPAAAASLIERYAWRAPLLGPLGDGAVEQTVPRFPTASVSWDGRIEALGLLADLSDKDELTLWTVDTSLHQAIIERLAAHGVAAHFVAEDAAVTGAVVFVDAPPAGLLDQANPATSVLLVPPGVERYAARVIGTQQPITLPNPTEAAALAVAADRRVIRQRIEGGPDRGAFSTLAPLFDRWSAAEIAVALQSLWLEARTKTPAPASRPAPSFDRRPKTIKVWTSVGKKEGVTFGEWLGLLTLDLGIAKHAIGKIDTKETFTLIEFTSDTEAKAAVEKLAGRTFKNRRITARIDRGRDRPS